MTSLEIHSLFDYLTDTSVAWRKADHKATKLVKAVKGTPFNGHLEAKIKGQTRRFTHPNCGEVVSYIASIMAGQISDLADGRICLVPIPNSHVVSPIDDYRSLNFTLKISEALADRSAAAGIFHWKVARNPQHLQKGHRHMSQFVPNLTMFRKPLHPVVLIDDMLTSGSQMLACTHLLRSAGCEVLFGMTVGRVAEQQKKNPIEWRRETFQQDLGVKR